MLTNSAPKLPAFGTTSGRPQYLSGTNFALSTDPYCGKTAVFRTSEQYRCILNHTGEGWSGPECGLNRPPIPKHGPKKAPCNQLGKL